jgi:hypothetical protein
MTRRLALVLAGAFAVSALMVGPVQAVCDPYCSPKSNEGGKLRGQDRSDWVHQYKDGGGGVPVPTPVPPPPSTPPPPVDTDGDSFPDAQDHCPSEAGVAPNGCPPPPPGA